MQEFQTGCAMCDEELLCATRNSIRLIEFQRVSETEMLNWGGGSKRSKEEAEISISGRFLLFLLLFPAFCHQKLNKKEASELITLSVCAQCFAV